MRSPRVLVLRALGLGDLLAGVPALRALRQGLPDHEMVLAAPADLAPVAGATGAVDRLLPASAPGRAVPRTLDWTGPPRTSPSTCTATDRPATACCNPCAPRGCSPSRTRTPRDRGPALAPRRTRT